MINSYTDLVASVQSYLHRKDLAAEVPGFIQLAEADIRNDLVSKRIEMAVHGNFSGPIIQPPTDVEQIQRLLWYWEHREMTLEYATPATVEVYSRNTGRPAFYTQADQVIMIYPSPDYAYRWSLYYIPTLGDLTSAAPINWLLTRSPNCYLWKALHHAAIFLKDKASADEYQVKYLEALEGVRAHSERYRAALAGGLTVRPRIKRIR